MSEDDTATPAQSGEGKTKKVGPIPPNDFQKYVVEVTGQPSTLYGADFFENSRNDISNAEHSPVTGDYGLSAGDQLLVRTWGSASGEYQLTLDRNGEVSIPKLGTVKMAGVTSSQAEDVLKSVFARHYKDFEISLSPGKLRKITVYAVGQSRFPGSYNLSSQSTLSTAPFASGGPSSNGSVRRVQLKRNNAMISEFDLYSFLSKGDESADVKLQDGDVIYFPRAAGDMAFIGKVNTPGVYEIKDATETVGDFLGLAAGLSMLADPRQAKFGASHPGFRPGTKS
ncbi:MAG: polysaccharide biosynthesis/export family protein [Sterolibacterium sp.]